MHLHAKFKRTEQCAAELLRFKTIIPHSPEFRGRYFRLVLITIPNLEVTQAHNPDRKALNFRYTAMSGSVSNVTGVKFHTL